MALRLKKSKCYAIKIKTCNGYKNSEVSLLCNILSPLYSMLSLAWARNTNSVKRLQLLQNKSLRIMFLRNRNFHTSPLLKDFKILKPFDETALENYIFITKSLKGLLPPVFNSWFKLSFESHSHNTRWSILGYVKIPCYCTKSYGRYSMFVNAVCLESLSKLLSIHFICWEQINWKRC